MIFSGDFLRHFTWLHTNFRVESLKLSGVEGAKGEGWYGETKGETWWRPGRDRFLGLDSSSIGFYVQKYLLMPIFKTRRPVSPSQIGAQRSQRSGTKSAREFELFLAQPLCWPMQNQGVLIYCRENMSAPSHVHLNTFFCTVSTFELWTIWILARFLSHFFGTFVPRFDCERPVASSWKLAWVSIFGRRIRWKKNQVPETGRP